MDLIKTGIPGFDEALKGGLPKNRHILLIGGPGTGKTIFATQFLYNGVKKYKEKGLFISLEEPVEKLTEDMKSAFGWDLAKMIKDKQLFFETPRNFVLKDLLDIVDEGVGKGAKRVVLDSVNLLSLGFESGYKFRRGFYELLEKIRQLDCNMIITAERDTNELGKPHVGLEEYIVDGVIVLYNPTKEDSRLRAIEIMKMRGISHSNKLSPFGIEKGGIKVYHKQRII
jgi:circadian clock protein KaiC